MTQGFKYFMVFLSQSTEEKMKRKKESREMASDRTLASSFLSHALILNLSQQDVLPTKMKEAHGSNTDTSGLLALRLQFRCHCQPCQRKKGLMLVFTLITDALRSGVAALMERGHNCSSKTVQTTHTQNTRRFDNTLQHQGRLKLPLISLKLQKFP